MTPVIFAIAIGALCALFRFRALMILAVSALVAGGAVLSSVILQFHPWVIAAEGVASIVILQCVYVAVGLTRDYFQSRAAIPQMQSAIGQMLRTELEVPRNLPPDLAALVARLQVT